jgi:hypothetical protein
MRTTIRLPDDLYAQVRAAALQADGTVTSFIEEALRAALLRRAGSGRPRDRYRVQPFTGTGTLPGIDLANSGALLEVMDADAHA